MRGRAVMIASTPHSFLPVRFASIRDSFMRVINARSRKMMVPLKILSTRLGLTTACLRRYRWPDDDSAKYIRRQLAPARRSGDPRKVAAARAEVDALRTGGGLRTGHYDLR